MSTEPGAAQNSKTPSENVPAAFASLRSAIEGMLAEIQTLDPSLKDTLQQSLTQTTLAVEDQVLNALAADRAAQKATFADLRARYVKELELAITEKGVL